jgi:hypothetical protein
MGGDNAHDESPYEEPESVWHCHNHEASVNFRQMHTRTQYTDGMQPEAWKQIGEVLKDGWLVLAPFIGLFIGARLTRSGERNKWLNDCRKEEFKELLTTLTNASIALIKERQPEFGDPYLRPEKIWEAQDSYMRSLEVLRSRIFISDDLDELKVYTRWAEAMKTMVETKSYGLFEKTFEQIRSDIINVAKQPI